MSAAQKAELAQHLARGLAAMALALDIEQQQRLIAYLLLLHKWNAAYNLSAVRKPLQMVSRHLLDSLTLLADIDALAEQGRILDIGTGPGLPGIPLAISCPQRQFVLLDSNGKKTRFLFQVKLALSLDNIEIVQQRIADYQPGTAISIVVSRAFSSLRQLIQGCDHLRPAHILAMKGEYPQAELAELLLPWQLQGVRAVTVPAEPGQRHIVHLSRSNRENSTT